MADERKEHRIKIVRRTRETGGALLLPGKEYPVTKADFLELIRSGKGVDPAGKVAVTKARRTRRDTGKEASGGTGEAVESDHKKRAKGKATAKATARP
jgi:hypothetical protein